MCTWPKGGAETAVPGMEKRPDKSERWSGPGGYFDETMNGFEYQVASHMIYEGLPEKGLVILKAVHDRYNPIKRNPYNEIECSDHYSRSMASYGVLLAVCGLDYHGPKGQLSYAPRLRPEAFLAPFTAAKGWGTLTQTRKDNVQENIVEIKYGELKLNQLTVQLPEGKSPQSAHLKINGREINARGKQSDKDRYTWTLDEGQLITGDRVQSVIGF
jgi:hypothetical protein